MARGIVKHTKRINAPYRWMLDKLGGNYALTPRSGPTGGSNCIPLGLLLKGSLAGCLTHHECKIALMKKRVLVDGKAKTDQKFPCGLMDVITIKGAVDVHYRVLTDAKGRFKLMKISEEESTYKLCAVKRSYIGTLGLPHAHTHDGRTLKHSYVGTKANDVFRYDLVNRCVLGQAKLQVGAPVLITKGNNVGRLGRVVNIIHKPGLKTSVQVKDLNDVIFSTLADYAFVIGENEKIWISIDKTKAVKISDIDAIQASGKHESYLAIMRGSKD